MNVRVDGVVHGASSTWQLNRFAWATLTSCSRAIALRMGARPMSAAEQLGLTAMMDLGESTTDQITCMACLAEGASC